MNFEKLKEFCQIWFESIDKCYLTPTAMRDRAIGAVFFCAGCAESSTEATAILDWWNSEMHPKFLEKMS